MLRRATIPLPLAGFGLELLERESARSGVTQEAFVAEAAERYVAEADHTLPSARVPAFLKEHPPKVAEQTVDVELEPGLWTALERAAAAQEVPVELLVTHAAIWLAAKLEP